MKVAITGVGTRGDIQPFLLLGRALVERGHDAIVYASPDFADLASELGVPFQGFGRPFAEVQGDMQRAFEEHPVQAFFGAIAREMVLDQARAIPPLVRGADVVVGNSILFMARSAAEAAGIPYLLAILQPGVLPASEYPPPVTSRQDLPRWMNRILWGVAGGIYNAAVLKYLNEGRATLGLARVSDVSEYIYGAAQLLIAVDPVLTGPLPAWRYPHVVTGLWQSRETERPLPPEIDEFLEAGPPPVYVSFGSITGAEPMQRTRAVVAAVRQAGVRAIFSAEWPGLGQEVELPDGCMASGPLPHAAFLPRCAAIVHHGGAGTTAAAALAGLPQVVVPHLLDQHFWAFRVLQSGLGPRTFKAGQLTADRLAIALTEACSGAYLTRAQEVASQLRQRDGLAEAVTAIEAAVRGR